MERERGNVVVWILIVGAVAAFLVFSGGEDNSSYISDEYRLGDSRYQYENKTIERYDAIYEHWDEIRDYVSGTETIDACSYESGNCYSLDAEISDGEVEMIYFPNGGYLYFSADIDEQGSASDSDQNGNGWDFTIDMDSSIIDDAVYEWANDNGYEVE